MIHLSQGQVVKPFLEYIREQVEQFILGVSQKMLQFENFNTIESTSVQISGQLNPIFIEADKRDGAPIPISHEIQFTGMSLGSLNLGK